MLTKPQREAIRAEIGNWMHAIVHYKNMVSLLDTCDELEQENERLKKQLDSQDFRELEAYYRTQIEKIQARLEFEKEQQREENERLRKALKLIVANRVADGGPCDRPVDCSCSECIAREALGGDR